MTDNAADKPAVLQAVETAVGYLRVVLGICVGCLTVAVFFCVAANVFGRFVLNNSYPWTEEMSRFFFIWTVLLGAGLGCLNDENIAVTFFRDSMPRALAKIFDVLRIIVVYVICIVIIAAYQQVMAGFVSFTPILGIPKSTMYVAMPVLAVLMFIANSVELLRFVLGPKGSAAS